MTERMIRLIISEFAAGLALLLNSILAFIILTTRTAYVGKYRYFLFAYTLSAVIFALTLLLSAPSFFQGRSGYVVYDNLAVFPVPLGNTVIQLFVCCCIVNVWIICLSFIYRYYVFCNPNKAEKYLRQWKRIVLISVVVIVYLMLWIGKTMWPNEHCESELGEEFYNRTHYDIHDHAYLCAPLWIKGSLNMELFLCISTFGVFVTISVAIDSICAWRIMSALKDTSKYSQTVVKKQKKLFVLLILQLLIPFVFNLLPENLLIAMTYFGIPMGHLDYISCLFSLAQIIDPLLIFTFIAPYRIALTRRISKRATTGSIHGSLPPIRGSSRTTANSKS